MTKSKKVKIIEVSLLEWLKLVEKRVDRIANKVERIIDRLNKTKGV